MIPNICVDTFERLPVNLGFARSLFGVETRVVNKRARGSVSFTNISRRSIGKIDNNQYVTNDPWIWEEARNKQEDTQFRRHQKLMVSTKRFLFRNDVNYSTRVFIGDGCLLHIVTGTSNGEDMRCRVHASKAIFPLDVSYNINKFTTPSHVIRVEPANVLNVHDAALHYFDKLVCVTTKDSPGFSIREQYTMIKISQNIIFAETK